VTAVAAAGALPNRLGKYELVLPLAAGGMARIYIGRSTGIGSFERHVVLKLITPERANDHTAVQMFLDEARLAASLNHQNVAQVFEVGEDVGIHYLAMEYVHGQDLRALLAKAGGQGTRIPIDLALTVIAGAAAGLNHAHERRGPDGLPLGIVHRDVSPSNLMIGYDGSVKLLDFGIAKATSRSVETQSGIIKGKFAYMAPEQCRGREVDRRSDVFSLGIILYEITTQHRCFRADSDFDTMHRIVTGDVVRPTRVVQGYPPALEAIVMKALAVDPVQRYQSAGALLEAIESFAVTSRMSLSTMALGRFMRDMFGEIPEPWLVPNRITPMPGQSGPRESTVSSTGDGTKKSGSQPSASGSRRLQGHPESIPPIDEDFPLDAPTADVDDSDYPDAGNGPAARTILDLPRGAQQQREDARVDWNAASYPAPAPVVAVPPRKTPAGGTPQAAVQVPPKRPSQPSISQPASVPAANVDKSPSSDRAVAVALPSTPSGQMAAVPPLAIASTKHGYAGGAITRDAPTRSSSHDFDAPTRNRKPLIIGGALAGVGLIVVLAVALGGGGKDPKLGVTAGSDKPAVETGSEHEPVKKGGGGYEPAPVDKVTLAIRSVPSEADVYIDGEKVDTTPCVLRRTKADRKVEVMLAHKGYSSRRIKIDLNKDYDGDPIALVATGDSTTPDKTVPDKTVPDPVPDKTVPDKTIPDRSGPDHSKNVNTKSGGTTTTDHSGDHKATQTTTSSSHKTTEPPKPKCQPKGSVDPFSDLPICK